MMNQNQNVEKEDEREEIQHPQAQKVAKMLVVLKSGEQRLITFTLPKESCTIQELFEQFGIPFSPDDQITGISKPGGDIDYIIVVGLSQEDTLDTDINCLVKKISSSSRTL